MRSGKFIAAALLSSFFIARAGATPFTITPTFASSITSDPNAAAIEGVINTAIGVYESLFNNPINVNITFQEMSSGLGQSSFNLYEMTYSQFLTGLTANNAADPSANLTTALAHLPNSSNNPVTGTTEMIVKSADAKALGLASYYGFAAGDSDGTVSLNTSITTPGSPGTSGSYSLLAVTEHEIDEILGLGSTLGLGLPTTPVNYNTFPSPEDLYRYGSTNTRSFTTNTSATAYFSIDGTHMLTKFNNTGSGDFGDWAGGATHQVQDASGTPGATPTLGTNEITALNVIGYDLVSPEPGTWLLLSAGLAIIALIPKSRRI